MASESTADAGLAFERVVLRRVHKNDFDPLRRPPFLRGAFNPGPADTDGLSVYLEGDGGCTVEELAASGRKPGEYFVIRLTVGELAALGLTVLSTPRLDPNVAGHCSVPELAISQKATDPARFKDIQVQLMELAPSRIALKPSPAT